MLRTIQVVIGWTVALALLLGLGIVEVQIVEGNSTYQSASPGGQVLFALVAMIIFLGAAFLTVTCFAKLTDMEPEPVRLRSK